jgi:formyltetrahydrofolate synthetase
MQSVYEPPALVESGSFATLTRGAGVIVIEGFGFYLGD